MAELKTKKNKGDVVEFLNSVENEKRKSDSFEYLKIMKDVINAEPKMWGTSIVGFGSYTLKYANGKTGDWFLAGFSPRKQSMTLYIMSGFDEYDDLMSKLGKHTTGKSCLYIKKIEDVDQDVLRELIHKSVEHMKETNVA